MNRVLFSLVFGVASLAGFSDQAHAQYPGSGLDIYYNNGRGSSVDFNINNARPGYSGAPVVQNYFTQPATSYYAPPVCHHHYQPPCTPGYQSGYRWSAPYNGYNNGYSYGNYPYYRR